MSFHLLQGSLVIAGGKIRILTVLVRPRDETGGPLPKTQRFYNSDDSKGKKKDHRVMNGQRYSGESIDGGTPTVQTRVWGVRKSYIIGRDVAYFLSVNHGKGGKN